MIYLDHNATTPPDPRVVEAMQPYLDRLYGNPSSLHRLGRLARGAIDTARQQVAALVGADPSGVVFTSGGTEADNLAIKGLGFSLPRGEAWVGPTEHPAVTGPMSFLSDQGWTIRELAADTFGRTTVEALSGLYTQSTPAFASIMWANNETGVVNDIPALAGELHRLGALLHCDAVQAAGKLPIDLPASGVDLLSLSSHKICGPKGAGALVMANPIALVPLLHGGGQEHALRGGTENVAAIVGFGKAAELARTELTQRREHLLGLRTRLEQGLKGLPGVTIYVERAERLPNTVQFRVAGYDGEMLVMMLDRAGFGVSSGSACASEGGEPSPVLLAMGIAPDEARGAVRVSLGHTNSEADVDRFLSQIANLHATGVAA
ncbi:MAG: cysteine desulfurase family protein [Methylotetracoccus sp.]